jgi:uncharacterized protein (TIGR01244 family)
MIQLLALFLLQAAAVEQAADPLEGHAGIGYYYRVRPDVATAGQPSDEAWADIREAGFKAVLNLRTEQEGSLEERAKVEAAGLEYFNIPIGSDGIHESQVELFSKILGDSTKRPLLIHCASSNRVGAMWFIHEVLGEGKDESSALEEARKAGLKSSLEPAAREYISSKDKR